VAGRDEADACARLREGGFFVERIAPAARAPRIRARTRIATVHRIEFFRQMETLLSSGVLIADALNRLKDRFPDARTRRVLRVVHAQVAESRTSLSQALSLFPGSFPPGVVTAIEAGEEGGAARLAVRFAELAERAAYDDGNRRQVLNACAYPLFVLAMAAGLYALLLGVVFPRLAALLGSLGGGLPPLARRMIAASGWFRGHLAGLALAGAAIPIAAAGLRRIPRVRLLTDRWFLRLPWVGPIYRDISTALVCRAFSSLYRAGKPAPEIVGLCARSAGNRAIRAALEEMRAAMTSGGATVGNAFAQSGLFPPIACMAIDVGEQSGRLPESMDRVADHFNAAARRRIAAAIAVLNPLLTVLMVAGAGTVMISFFQALYQVVYVTR